MESIVAIENYVSPVKHLSNCPSSKDARFLGEESITNINRGCKVDGNYGVEVGDDLDCKQLPGYTYSFAITDKCKSIIQAAGTDLYSMSIYDQRK